MTTFTVTTDDLDRLAHAVLLAKCDYVSSSIAHSGERWRHCLRNIELLESLYQQIEAALTHARVEA